MMKDEVRIVFAINDQYIPPFGVALHSLIRHSDRNRFYKIFVLNEGIGSGHWKKVKSMEQPHVTVESVNVSEWMREHQIPTVNHLSKDSEAFSAVREGALPGQRPADSKGCG